MTTNGTALLLVFTMFFLSLSREQYMVMSCGVLPIPCHSPCLLVSTTTEIVALDFDNITSHPIMSGLTRAVAIDVHFSLGFIFWSDVTENKIKRSCIDGTNITIINDNAGVCDGLAVTSSQLYWTDTTRDTISVSDLEGNNTRILVSGSLDEPRGITLDTEQSLMFWTDWGSSPKIERSTLIGTQRVTLVTSNLQWPNSISLDRQTKLVYWVDAGTDRLESINYDGTNRTLLYEQSGFHFFGVTFLSPYIFFSEWTTKGVFKTNSSNGAIQGSVYFNGADKLMGLVPYDSSRQLPDKPTIIVHPDAQTKTEGENVNLVCDATGNPHPRISWTRNGISVDLSGNSRISFSADKKQLTITNVSRTDSGEYRCVANNSVGNDTSNPATLNVQYQPEITVHQEAQTKTEGNNVTISCGATGNPVPTISWTRNGSPIDTSGNSRISVSADRKQLTITNVSRTDSGEYRCVANNSLGNDTSNMATLDIQYKPTIIVHPEAKTKTEGDNVTLSCDTTGNPAPTISWTRNGSPIDTSGRISFSADKKQLTITNVSRIDSGEYRCVTNNSLGNDTSNPTTLNVQYQPEITVHPEAQTKTEGDSATLSCGATGNPVPTISWTRNGSPINTSGNSGIGFSADRKQLTITNVSRTDSGEYRCLANNSLGNDTSNIATLDVQYTTLIGNYDIKRCYIVDITFHYQISGGLTSSTIAKTRSQFSNLFQQVSGLLKFISECHGVTTSSEEIIASPPGVSSVFFRVPLIFTASSSVADDQVSSTLTNCINKITSNYKGFIDSQSPSITQDDVTYRKYNLSTISDKKSCCGGDIPPPCCSAGSIKVSSTKCGCVPGFQFIPSSFCVRCPSDTYQDKQGQTSCKNCPENKRTFGKTGMTSKSNCSGILCELLQLPPNLKMNVLCTRLPGDSCELACERGYDLIGSAIRLCDSGGSWTGTMPQCDAVTCPTLSSPTNGELLRCNTTEMLYDTVCRFSCKNGSQASGSTARRCTDNGTWSETDLVCTVNINSTAFVNVNESKSVVINCTFESGTPTWTRQDGGEVETTTRKIKNGVLLEIKKASIADTGVYVCTNGGNTHKITVQVLVEVKVEMALVVLNYGNFTEDLEDNTTLVYKATEKNFTTEMDKVHKGHTPGYVKTIVLKFSEGSVKVDFQIVIILVTNNPKNATTIADKKAEAAQRVVVRAKKGAVERLRVKAVIVKTVPLEPENVEIFGIDSDELSVRWQPSEDADAFEVSEYLVQHRAFSEKVYTNFNQRSSKDKTQYSYRVKPLEPETTYMVRVAAINKYGHNFNEESSHQTDPAPFAWWIILVVVLIILFVLGLLVGVILYRRKRGRERELAREEEPRFNALQREARSNAVALYEEKNVKGLTLSFTNDAYKPSELNWEEIPYENLKLLNELGSGAFGIVYKGELLQDNGNVTDCAVKALKPSATNEEIRDLYNELEIMTNVGYHPNLVNLIGACTEDGHLLVVLEIAENGSLLEFLKKSRQTDQSFENINCGLTEQMKTKIATDVARGMAHLATCRCIHRDLAARNVLLGADYVAKVSDYGMARDVYEQLMYKKETQGKLPVKWMAIESLETYIFTIESDVWAYGVLLWEMESGGLKPYAGLNTTELIAELKKGYRMEKPNGCSDEMYQVMRDCWNPNPKARPTFEQLVIRLGSKTVA